ncbi:MAG: sulfotransferase [Tuberibacillus sp.]
MDILISSGTHRSGSTLLQRMFNARKKTLVWGENGGCLTDFCNIYNQALHYSEHFGDVRESYFNEGQDPNQWIACMTPPKDILRRTLIQTIKDFHYNLYVKEYEQDFDMIGYKEVRYGAEELELFRECYPDAPVILLIRHPVDVWKSVSRRARKERYGSVEGFCDLWKGRVTEYLEMNAKDPNMHFIRYEDMIGQNNETISLIKELGQLTDEDIKRVLDVVISSSKKKTPPKDIAKINELCEGVMMEVGYEKTK